MSSRFCTSILLESNFNWGWLGFQAMINMYLYKERPRMGLKLLNKYHDKICMYDEHPLAGWDIQYWAREGAIIQCPQNDLFHDDVLCITSKIFIKF